MQALALLLAALAWAEAGALVGAAGSPPPPPVWDGLAGRGRKKPEFDWRWSDLQGRLLTGGGKATPGAYAPFAPEDLPHHHLERGSWREAYGRLSAAATGEPVTVPGAWARSLFAGAGGEADFLSRVVDIQTPGGAFADIRVPAGRADWSGLSPLRSLPPEQQLEIYGPAYLQALARQHAFAGVTTMAGEHATRHHVVDWNPAPRRTPNRFRVEPHPDRQSWIEMTNATDERGFSVYVERWERLPSPSAAPEEKYLALHRAAAAGSKVGGGREALLVVAGEHFLRVVQRQEPLPNFGGSKSTPNTASLADQARKDEDHIRAASLVSVDAAYGRISESGWVVELATLPWREGRELWLDEGEAGEDPKGAARFVTLDGKDRWEVLENSFSESEFTEMLQRMGRALPEKKRQGGRATGAAEEEKEEQGGATEAAAGGIGSSRGQADVEL